MLQWLKSKIQKHRHTWDVHELLNLEHHMLFKVRECPCGAKEVLHMGPFGDKKWHPIEDFSHFPWEREWFEAAQPVQEGLF